METITLPPSQQLLGPQRHTPPTNTMLSFDNPRANNPFASPYDHPYSHIDDFDESDYEPLIPARNPFRDPSLSSSNVSSTEQAARSANTSTNITTNQLSTPTNFRNAKHTNLYVNPPAPGIRYTDESIIPAIIVNVIPSPSTLAKSKSSSSLSSRPSFLRKLSLKSGGAESKRKDGNGMEGTKEQEKGILKVVYMPRKEYQKYFARGLRGEYVGSEPYRRWGEEELEEKFGRFKPVTIGRGRGRGRGRW